MPPTDSFLPTSKVRVRHFARELKSQLRRLAGIEDPWRLFRQLESSVHPDTLARRDEIGRWLDSLPAACGDTPEPSGTLARRGQELREQLRRRFEGKHAGSAHRVLIFLPDYEMSAAGYSLFRNLAEGFNYLGVPTVLWRQGQPVTPYLESFRPTLLMANDGERYIPEGYLDYIDWATLAEYRRRHDLRVGLVASPYPKSEADLEPRLGHARRLGVDFYYSFQAEEFIQERHAGYRRRGFQVLCLEFGANPLVYYPVEGYERDLDYVFMGSAHFEKWPRFYEYFGRILAARPGVLVGSGWSFAVRPRLPEHCHRHLYARARVGLNLHVPFQIEAPSELNERTYNLAACGVPQLVDHPRLLPRRFDAGNLYVGSTPAEYEILFRRILERPTEAEERAHHALEEVLTRHTIFHRADRFLDDLGQRVVA